MGVCLDKDLRSKTGWSDGQSGVEKTDLDVSTTKLDSSDHKNEEEELVKSKRVSLGGFVGGKIKSRNRRALKMSSEDDKKDVSDRAENGAPIESVVDTLISPLVDTESKNGHCDDNNRENETKELDVVDGVQVSTVDLSPRSESDTSSTTTTTTTMPNLPELTHAAPDFSGPAVVDGVFKDIKLSDYKGKYLVLFFYPLDFTFVCPTEIISFSDKAEEFKAINCEVIACSTDSQYSHFAWVNTSRKQGGLGSLKIPLLADKTGKIARDYGCYKEDEGIAFRGLYIIDDKSRLRQITINDLPVGRSVEETLRLVQAFQFTDKHGEVCPANWKPGDKTMKPDPNASKEYFEQKH